MNPPPGAFPPGTRLKVGSHDVVIKGYISQGGFAHVYVVHSHPADGDTDIACLKRVLVPDKIHLNLLRAEVDAMKRLKGHPNIVKYIDSHAARVPDGNGAYEVLLLMEYCSGNGLIDFMNARLREKLTETEVLKIMYDITYGLACMHYLQPALIHRDLKIENVLISADGTYKLCDFGSAAPALRPPKTQQEFHILQDDIQRNTTAQYRSPEMIDIYRGFPIDEKADIWALGVFLYKLCYYTTPFEREGQLAILHSRFHFPSKPAYSDRLKRIVSVCLSEDPRNRPNVYQVLKEVCSMRGVEVPIKDIYSGGQNVMSSQASSKSSAVATGAAKVPTVQHQVTQKKSLPEITPMYRGRPPKPATSVSPVAAPEPTSVETSSDASGAVFSDPFAFLDKEVLSKSKATTGTVPPAKSSSTTPPLVKKISPPLPKRPAKKPQSPVDSTPVYKPIDPENDDDVETRYPSVEELSSSMEKTNISYRSSKMPYFRSEGTQTDMPTLNIPINDAPSRPRSAARPRPVSMYARPNASSSLFGLSAENGSRESVVAKSPSTSAFLASRNVSDSSSSGSSLDLASSSKVDSLVPEDKDTLKRILTGLSERSVNLDVESNNHVDSSVDFLRSLDNEGHSISRAPSAGGRRSGQFSGRPSFDETQPGGFSLKMNRSTSQSSQHSKRSSISSIRSLFLDASNKVLDGNKDKTNEFQEGGRQSVDSSGVQPMAQSRRSLSSMRSQRTPSYGRKSEEIERPPPVTRRNTSNSIQNRIHNFLSRKHSPPPRRTAEGYGKYTDSYHQSVSTSALASAPEQKINTTETKAVKSSKEYSPNSTTMPPPPLRPTGRVRTPVGHHGRRLSDISSSSAASEKKTPPTKPKKPAHLQSPSPQKTAEETEGEDWEVKFKERYPDLV